MVDNTQRAKLDDPLLRDRARLSTQPRPITYQSRTASPAPAPVPSAPPVKPVQDIIVAPAAPPVQPTPAPTPQPPVTPPPAPPQPAPEPPDLPVPDLNEKLPTLPVGRLVQTSQPVSTNSNNAKPSFGGRRKLSLALTVLAVIAFGAGAYLGINALRTNRYVSAQLSNLRKTADPDAPSEDKPGDNDINSYQVPANDPRLLTISKLGVKARIRKLGVKANNELDAPKNIYDAGWYEGSSRPDEFGAMLLDGHVQGPTKPGIFINLDKLTAGDKISVERGDGQVFNYKVVKTQVYDVSQLNMEETLNSVDPEKKGLNIISCTGPYDPKTQNYKDRLVVYAVQE